MMNGLMPHSAAIASLYILIFSPAPNAGFIIDMKPVLAQLAYS